MGHIQIIALNVEGSDDTLRDAIKTAATVLNRDLNGEPKPEPPPGPLPAGGAALPAPENRQRREGRTAKFSCDQCDETFSSAGQRSAHKRYSHPKAAKKTAQPKAGAAAEDGTLWCPVKNCGRSFGKRGWLNNHLERDHGIKEGING